MFCACLGRELRSRSDKEAIMGKLVRDAMTPNPRTIGGTATVVEAAQIMDRADVGAIPVVDADDILVGIITDRDIAVRVVAAGRDPRSTTVADVATSDVSPAYPNEPLDDALEQMAYRQVRRLPVIDDDRVVGMLAQADMVHELKDKQAGRLVDEISHEPAHVEV
ncbi:MAG: CBS domain-containing protein [Actinobacteria bacterium]|nr:MAG: CBS domain-containing protein [Actinomycetota bacterium]